MKGSIRTALVVMAVTLSVTASALWSPSAAAVPTVVTASVSDSRVKVGQQVTVSGSVAPSDVDGRAVVLQFATGTGWRPMRHATTSAAGDYQMRVPTDWFGRHVLRVVAPATDLADQGVSDSQSVTVTPRYDPRGRKTWWDRFTPHARWDPCTTIGYRTNLKLAPSGSGKLVQQALKRVHAATGLRFHRLGSTRKVPFSTGPDSSQHLDQGLVIAWSTPRRVPALVGSVAGVGGSTAQRTGTEPWRYVYGGVSIDAKQKLPVGGFRKGASIGALLIHELGHAMGLAHVAAKSQIMNPDLQPTFRGRYEAGDLSGLHHLGAEQGCFS